MKKLIMVLSLASCFSLRAQVTRQWAATYNGTGDFNDRYTCVTTDAAGNILIGGSTTNNGTDRDYLVTKLSSSGTLLWSKQYSGAGLSTDEVTAIVTDASNNVYVTGFAKGYNTSEDYLTIKYNSNGDVIWTQAYDYATEYDQANGIAVDGSGNVYVTGLSDQDPTPNTNDDYATVKYSSTGTQVWVQRFNNALGDATDQATGIVTDPAGNSYVTGRSNNGNDDDYVTIKYNTSGTQVWIKYDDFGGRDRATAITKDANSNNIYITGRSDNGNNADYVTVMYSSAGVQQWNQNYDFVDNDYATGIAVDASGNVFVTGESDADASALTNYDYQTVAYGPTGTQLWQKRYAGAAGNEDLPNGIKVSGNTVLITGQSDMDATVNTLNNIVSISYTTTTGAQNWLTSFAGSPNNDDQASAVVPNATGCVVVGFSEDANARRNAIAIQYNTSGTQQWTYNFNGYGDNNDNVRALAIDAANNVYAAGYNVEKGQNRNMAMAKFSSAGAFVCTHNIDGTSTGSPDDAQSILLNNAGNPVIAGFTKNKGTSNDIAYATFNTNCDTLFTKTIDAPAHGSDKIYDMVKDAAGNFYLTGRVDADATGNANDNCYTAKINSAGTVLWARTYNGSGVNEDRGTSVRVSTAGNVYVTGRSWNGVDYDVFILKYNSAGAQQWVHTYHGGFGNDEPRDMVLDATENVYITGFAEELTDSVHNYVTLKYDAAGALQWESRYDGTAAGDDQAVAIAIDGNGEIVVTGESDVDASANINYDIVTVKYNAAGAQQWVKNFNGAASLQDSGDDIAVNASNQIYLTGHTNKGSDLVPNYDAITMILDPSGNTLWSDIYNNSSDSSDVPNTLLLNGNDFYVGGSAVESNQMRNMLVIKYTGSIVGVQNTLNQNNCRVTPNPFNEAIYIATPNEGLFELYNYLGENVFSRNINAGESQLLLPTLPTGMYFYQIRTASSVISSGKLCHVGN